MPHLPNMKGASESVGNEGVCNQHSDPAESWQIVPGLWRRGAAFRLLPGVPKIPHTQTDPPVRNCNSNSRVWWLCGYHDAKSRQIGMACLLLASGMGFV